VSDDYSDEEAERAARALISRRTKEAHARRRAQGGKLGTALKPRKAVKEMVQAAAHSRRGAADDRALALEGPLRTALESGGSYVRAAALLNEAGRIAPPRGGLWRDTTVRNLLLRAEKLRQK
jgi:hypothetical protein